MRAVRSRRFALGEERLIGKQQVHVQDLASMHVQHVADAPRHAGGIDDNAALFVERALETPADFARAEFIGA